MNLRPEEGIFRHSVNLINDNRCMPARRKHETLEEAKKALKIKKCKEEG